MLNMGSRVQRLPMLLALALGACLLGCTTGPMKLKERYYIGASNGTDRVYYRVSIYGRTTLGIAEFRQGWYPARAVDALFGDVTDEGAAEELAVRQQLRKQIDDATLAASKSYVEAAADPETPQKDLEQRLQALERIRKVPKGVVDPTSNSELMQYDPKRDLVFRNADHKLVLVLSSNPDEVVGQLAALSEETRTQALVNKMSRVVGRQARAKDIASLSEARAEMAATRAVIDQIDALAAKLNEGLDEAHLKAEIEALITLLTSILEGR